MRSTCHLYIFSVLAFFLAHSLSASPGAASTALYERLFPDEAPQLEFYSSTSFAAHSLYSQGGFDYVLEDSQYDPGWRIRGFAGIGRYSYQKDDIFTPGLKYEIVGEVQRGELLFGYLFRQDPLLLKIYAGPTLVNHVLSAPDPENELDGMKWGAKVQLESWLNINESGFFALSAGYGTAHREYNVNARAGYLVFDHESFTENPLPGIKEIWLGPELRAMGNATNDEYGVGANMRVKFNKFELDISVGALNEYSDDFSFYGSIGLVYKKHLPR